MIDDQDLPELTTYRRFERLLPFEMDASYDHLVRANGNDKLPVHRWFRYKESFSADLLKRVAEELIPQIGKRFSLLDPFCGVGTTLIAAQELKRYGYEIAAIGIERNPFAGFVSETKVNWGLICRDKLKRAGERILNRSLSSGISIPPLSSLTQGRCMSTYMARKIVNVRDAISNIQDEATRNALLLGLAAAIEPVSKIRKDGRALRIVNKSYTPLAPVLRREWSQIGNDAAFLQELLPQVPTPKVIIGDGRMPLTLDLGHGKFDLILTSPPYPNNIDYSEVYKLELWLLGFIKNNKEFLQLRKSTLRSHPTAKIPAPSAEFIQQLQEGSLHKLLWPILKRIDRSNERWRSRLVTGYFSDMWLSLKEYYKCLRHGGYLVLVIGNSLHGRPGDAYLIPTDISVSVMAESIGFSVEKLLAARSLMRRLEGNHFLRESIIVLKKG